MLHVLTSCLILLSVNYVNSIKLPTYVKPCSRNDPMLNQCAKTNGQAGITKFIEGDRKYRIPKLNPLSIKELVINHGGGNAVGLKMIGKDAQLYGLEETIIDDIQIDLKNKHFDWFLNTPVVSIITKYTVDGRILLLPINGKGDANITLVNLRYKMSFDFDLVKKQKDGKEYIKLKNDKLDYNLDRVYMNLEGLFNNDPLLGSQMNKFLNENWKEVSTEVGPTIAQAISYIANTILTNIADLVPYDEIFPNKI